MQFCENRKYLSSIMDDLTIIFDEVIESYDKEGKNIPSNFRYFTCTFTNYCSVIDSC